MFCPRNFEFWLLLELQDVCNESQDKNTLEARFLKSVVDQKKIVVVEVWFFERAYTMREKYGNGWVEYRDPTDWGKLSYERRAVSGEQWAVTYEQ